MSKVTGGKKKPARQSLDKNGSHEKIVYRESIDSIVQTVSLFECLYIFTIGDFLAQRAHR
jgi:hypothetical protein